MTVSEFKGVWYVGVREFYEQVSNYRQPESLSFEQAVEHSSNFVKSAVDPSWQFSNFGQTAAGLVANTT